MMPSLHSQIMNIPCFIPRYDTMTQTEIDIRKHSHSKAIAAAAELALPFDAFVDAIRRISESGDVGESLDQHLNRLDGEAQ